MELDLKEDVGVKLAQELVLREFAQLLPPVFLFFC